MNKLRFDIGSMIMCNLGDKGWKLGQVISLYYREDHWPLGQKAPYQVLIKEDHSLIYVPADDNRCCRKATPQDSRMAHRMDALGALPENPEENTQHGKKINSNKSLCCNEINLRSNISAYRNGMCHSCHNCPQNWSNVELYSEHYCCAERNELKVTRIKIDLGTKRVGESLDYHDTDQLVIQKGFLQGPTLVRLPRGITFSDEGKLSGEIKFDPHRSDNYRVDFVAVSTSEWQNPEVGIVRLEISFQVKGNYAPQNFNQEAFQIQQDKSRTQAQQRINTISDIWEKWEYGELANKVTCEQIITELEKLRELLEVHPRLDEGYWWTQLGGFYMNVHKLLENTLFECELYLGHALTFGNYRVRQLAEQNLEGCYQKRQLEAARFMWIEATQLMMQGKWHKAAEMLKLAALKKDGWGWAVNYGDIWISESVALLIYNVEQEQNLSKSSEAKQWLPEVKRLLELADERSHDAQVFGPNGHPWIAEIHVAIENYEKLTANNINTSNWLIALKQKTLYWCGQILAGEIPFPPKPKARLNDAQKLIYRLPS